MFGGRFGFTRFGLSDTVNIMLEALFDETAETQVLAVKDTALSAEFDENIYTKVILSKYTPLEAVSYEALFTLIRADLIEVYSFEINAEISPGSELRINSEQFEVTLNGVSIIHLYSGDWVNISRNTLNVDITSDKPLNGNLIYLERFL